MNGQVAPGLGQAGQVDVLARALAGREIGAQDPYAEPAEDLELVARCRGAPHQRQGLGQRVARGAPARPVRCGHAASLLADAIRIKNPMSWCRPYTTVRSDK
jgi:hypothetical protein